MPIQSWSPPSLPSPTLLIHFPYLLSLTQIVSAFHQHCWHTAHMALWMRMWMPSHITLYFIFSLWHEMSFEAAADHEHFYSFCCYCIPSRSAFSLNAFALVIGNVFSQCSNLLLLQNTCKNFILFVSFALLCGMWIVKSCKTYSEMPSTNNQKLRHQFVSYVYFCNKWTNSMNLTYSFLIHSLLALKTLGTWNCCFV